MSRSNKHRRRSSGRARSMMPDWIERRMRWNRGMLLGSTGIGGVLAGLALGAGSTWAQPGAQPGANTLPTNGQVVAGSATINQANPNTLNINQTTDRAVINWSSFDVGASASVNFYQPNSGSWTLNRVSNSVAPSQIFGHITANGNIAVINSNGVIFGAGSKIDVNGLIATTANITDQNFMAGNMKFDQAGNPTASVSNFGDITVKDAGLVAFVAPGVQNAGTITARLGTVSLSSGTRFTIDLYGDKLVSIATNGDVDQAPIGPDGKPLDSLVSNSGRISADGGAVRLTARQAKGVVDTAVNMTGVVQAQSAYVEKNGDIVLDGGASGDVKVTGTLDASGKNPGTKGGSITVTGKNNVVIGSTAKLDASGDAGGGKIKIGGDFHGQGTTPTAKKTTVVSGAQINANAVNTGNGGQVVIWADDSTNFYGNISARGGAISGNGGYVEVSAPNLLFSGQVDTRAIHGQIGTLLLDPVSLTISNAPDAVGNINDAALSAELEISSVNLQSSVLGVVTGTDNQGLVIVKTGANVVWHSGANLGIAADNTNGNQGNGAIDIQSGVVINGDNGANVELNAAYVTLSSNIMANVVGSGIAHDIYITNNAASVQDGIDTAGIYGTVHLASNTTWAETLNIKLGIVLQGGTNSVIDGSALSGSVITVNAADVVPIFNTVLIDHVSVIGNSSTAPIVFVKAANTFTFSNGTITGSGVANPANGIETYIDPMTPTHSDVGNFTVVGSTISNMGGAGVVAQNAGAVVIDGNEIFDTVNGGIIVRSQNWTSAEITENRIAQSGSSILKGIVLSQGNGLDAPIAIAGNTIGNGSGSALTGTGGIIVATNAGHGAIGPATFAATTIASTTIGLIIVPAVTVAARTIGGNTVSGVFGDGISISSGLGTIDVAGNTIDHLGLAGNGIHVGPVAGSNIHDNVITGVGTAGASNGIFVDSGAVVLSNILIANNMISRIGGDGILVDPVFGPTVIGNNVFNVGGNGIEVGPASGSVTILNNIVNATGGHGIYVHDITGVAADTVAMTPADTISIAGNVIGNNKTLGTVSGGGIGGDGILVVDGGAIGSPNFVGNIYIANNNIGADTDGNGAAVPGLIAGHGIETSNLQTVTISANVINNVSLNGIQLSIGNAAVVSGNSIAARSDGTITGDGINFSGIVAIEVTGNSIGFDALDSQIMVGGNAISGLGGTDQTIAGNKIGAGANNDSYIGGSGITVSGAGNSTISGNFISNVGYADPNGDGIYFAGGAATIANNAIFNFGGNGIELGAANQVTVANNFVSFHHGAAVGNGLFATGVGALTITKNTFSAVNGAGISVDGANTLIIGPADTYSGNRIDFTGDDGIKIVNLDGTASIGGNTIGATGAIGGNGIEVGSSTIASLSIANNTINATANNGIYVHDFTGAAGTTIAIENNLIANRSAAIGGDGIFADGGAAAPIYAGDIYINGNSIGVDTDGGGPATPGQIAGHGIETNNLQTVTIYANVINNVALDGIHLSNGTSAVIDGNNIAGTQDGVVGGNGIYFDNVDNVRITNNGIAFDGLDSDFAILGDGIHGIGSTSLTITGNSIGDGLSFSPFIGGAGISISGAGNTTISDNSLRNVGAISHGGGIHWTGAASADVTISNNNAFNYFGDGIVVSDAGAVSISGNNFSSNGSAIATGNGLSVDNFDTLLVLDNTFISNRGVGITVSNGGATTIGQAGHGNTIDFIGGDGIYISSVNGAIDISGNTIGAVADFGGSGTIGGNGIKVTSSTVTSLSVIGNTIDATKNSGIVIRTISAAATGAVVVDSNVIGSHNTIGDGVLSDLVTIGTIVAGAADNGIAIGNVTGLDVYVTDNQIGQGARIFYSGIEFGTFIANGFGGGNATLSGNVIDRVGHHGLEGGNVTTNIVVDGTSIGTHGVIGLLGGDTDAINVGTAVNVTISNNVIGNATVSNLRDDGIVTANNTGVAVIDHNTVQRTRDSGIIFGGNGSVSVTNNTVLNSGGAGVLIVGGVTGTVGNVYVGHNTITGAFGTSGSSSGDGIQVTGNFPASLPFQITGDVVLEGNTINGTTRRAISVFGVAGGVSVLGNIIGNNNASGNIGTTAILVNQHGTAGGGDVLVSNNFIGVDTDGHTPATIGDTGIQVSNRTGNFSIVDNSIASFVNYGVLLSDLVGDATVSGNSIAGGNYGVAIHAHSGGIASIDGNSIANAGAIGIDINNGSSIANTNTQAEISGNTIIDSATGIRIIDGTGGVNTTEVMLGSGNSISGSVTGLEVNGSGTSLVGNTLNDMVFVGVTGNYVELLNGALDNKLIDGRNASYNGIVGGTASPTQVTDIEDKIIDVAEDGNVGDIVVNNSLINVDGGGLQAIQDALDFGNGANVFVAAGTYSGTISSAHSPDGALTVWADAETLNGLSAPQLDFSSVAVGSGVVISGTGDSFSGFGLINTGFDVSVILVTGVNAQVTGNFITASNSDIDGIKVQASGALIDGNLIVGPGGSGAGNGINIDSGAATLTGIVISNNSITGFGHDGILVDPVFNASVMNNDISNVAGNGIEVTGSVGDLFITSNTVNATGANAIYVHNANGIAAEAISIDGNTIGNDNALGDIGGNGILVDNAGNNFLGNIIVTNNRIAIDTDGAGPLVAASITNSGIDIELAVGNVSISGNSIGSNTNNAIGSVSGKGVWVDFASGTVDIGSNTVYNTGGAMIEVDSASISVAVHDNTLIGSLNNGVAVFNSSTVAISDNTINTSSSPIFVQQVNAGGLTIDGNTMYLGGGDAIQVFGNINGGTTVVGNSIGNFNGIAINIFGQTSGDLVVQNNLIDLVSVGLQATNSTVTGNVLVDNNTIDNVRMGDAIKLANVTGTIAVTNNRLASFLADSTIVGGNGISIAGLAGGGAITISDNRIADNSGTGGILNMGGDGVFVTGAPTSLVISGNIIGDANSKIGGSGIEVTGGTPLTNVTIATNTIVNFGANGPGSGLKVTNIPSPATVQAYGNVIHNGGGDAIVFTGVGQSTIGGTGTLGNVIDNVTGNGISVGNYTGVTVVGNLIATSGTIFGSGVTIDNGTNVDIESNRIGNNSTGTVVVVGGQGISVQGFTNLTIDGNTVGGGAVNDSRIGGTGIVLSGGNMATVSNNVIRNTGYTDANADGIRFSPGGTISATGNSVFNVANNGIELSSLTSQIVTGNTIDGNHDARGGVGGSGITVNGGTSFTATGNTIGDVAQAGISVANPGTAVIGVSGAGNTISNADGYGVRLNNVGSSTVSANTIGTTPFGVEIFGGGPDLISLNSISVSGMFATGVTVGGTAAPLQVLFNDIGGGNASVGLNLADGNFTIQNNNVTGFGIGLRTDFATVVTSANSVFNNNFSGNTVGVQHDGSGIIQASGNYWGFVNDSGPGPATFQSYFTGNALLGTNSGQIDVTPFLKDGTDGNGAALGFVGNFHNLFVTDLGSQYNAGVVSAFGRVQEAVNLIPGGPGTKSIEMATGTFLDNVVINRADITNLKLFGQGTGNTLLTAFNPGLAVISATAINTALPGDLTFQGFDVSGTTGATADGIVTNNVSHVLVKNVHAYSLTNATGFDIVGGSDIAFDGIKVDNSVGVVGKDGIALTSVTGATIGNNSSIGNIGRDGISVLDSTGVDIGNGVSINGVGRDGIRVQSDGPSSAASIGGVTIVNATDNGVNIISGAGGIASVAFLGGTSISNNVAGAFDAVRVDGSGALLTLPTPDGTTDLSLNIQAGDTAQNYFFLTNTAMGGTVTLGYDVNFIGLTGMLTSLQTYGLTAATLTADQIAALFQIEDRTVHAIDDSSLGLIRLIPDALFPTAAGGLNGVQNAIQLSNSGPLAQDTVFLQAGDYADPSNLVPGGIVIDRNIKLIGAQAGNSAIGRDPTDATTETILDFNSATIAPSNGISITDPAGGPGVIIDGIAVQVGANQGYGISIDTSAARDTISILNSFVRGSSANNATGNGIQTAGGTSTVTGLTITGNVVEFFNGDGINLSAIDDLVLQNNRIGAVDMVPSIGGYGIIVSNSSFATSLSGNTVINVGSDGIFVQTNFNALVVQGNTIDSTASGNGINISSASAGVTVSGNSIAAENATSIGGIGIRVDSATGEVLVTGTFIATAAGATTSGDGIVVQNTAGGDVSISSNTIGNATATISGNGIQVINTGIFPEVGGNVFVLNNSIQSVANDGVSVDPTLGDVTVNGQNILNVGGNGIHVFQTSGKVIVGAGSATGNTVNGTGLNGILVDETGEIPGPIVGSGGVTVAGNTLGNLAGSTIGSSFQSDAIRVADTYRGDVLVEGNSIASGDNAVVTGSGVQVISTSGNGGTLGNVTVQKNTIASGSAARVMLSGVAIDNTSLGSVSVWANTIAGGAGAYIGRTAISVQSTSNGMVSVGGNTIGGSGATITGNGIAVSNTGGSVTVASNTIAPKGDTITATGIVVFTTSGAQGARVLNNTIGSGGGAVIGLDGIRVTNTTFDARVTGNRIGASASIGGDGINVSTTFGDVSISSNTIGSGGPGVIDDGIEVFNSFGAVSVASNTVFNVGDNGIRVGAARGTVTVSANTINATGNDAISIFDTGAGTIVTGVLVQNNRIGSQNGTFIDGNGVFVDQTNRGNVTVMGNSIGQGTGVTGLQDGVHISNTALGGISVISNRIGGATTPLAGDGVEVLHTGLGVGATGGVLVNGNTIAATFIGPVGLGGTVSGNGIVVSNTNAGNVTVTANRVAAGTAGSIGLDGIFVQDTNVGSVSISGNSISALLGTIGGNGIDVLRTQVGVSIGGNTIGTTFLGPVAIAGTVGNDGIHVGDTSTGGVTVVSNRIVIGGGVLGSDGIEVDNTMLGGVTVATNTIGSLLTSIAGNGIAVTATGTDPSAMGGATGGVSIANNIVGSYLGGGSTIGSYGILVDNTGTGSVSVIANRVGDGVGAIIGLDAIRITGTAQGDVLAQSNTIANTLASSVVGDGIHVGDTTLGSVTVQGNTIGGTHNPRSLVIGGDGIDVSNTAQRVAILNNRIAAGNNVGIGGDGIVVNVSHGVDVSGNSIASGTNSTIGANGVSVSDSQDGGVHVDNNRIGTGGNTSIAGNGVMIGTTVDGFVSVSGNSIATGAGATIAIDGVNVLDTQNGASVTVSSNTIGNATGLVTRDGIRVINISGSVLVDANSIQHVGGVGIDLQNGNAVAVTGNTLSTIDGGGVLALLVGDTTIDNNALDHVTGNGIFVQNAADLSIIGNTISTASNLGIAAVFVANATIDNNALDHVGNTGIYVSAADAVSIGGNTLSTVALTQGDGIALFNVTSAVISNDTVFNVNGDGLHLERTNTMLPSMAVSVASVTIDGSAGAGIRLFDNDGVNGGGTIALQVGSGVSISNVGTGLIVDGPDTRNIGKTLSDMKFVNIGGGTGDYIHLQNTGWYEDDSTPNGVNNPTQIDATHVSFDGVVAGSLNPAATPADVMTLANLEKRIFHFLDDATLGLIRIQANSISLPTANGLNGIQLADYASANGDTIFLVAGTYGDPSDLVPNGVIIDKQITLLGWQHGVSAKTGGRDGVTNESILDFAGATIAPTAGIVIKESNVTIDGVVVLLDASETGGGIVVDTSVARSNITIVDNFVHGTSGAFAGGPGILTNGSSTVTGLNISDNVFEFVDGNGIFVNHVTNLMVQNNVVGNAAFGATNVNGAGITIANSTFSASVSGNVITWVQNGGIDISTTGNVAVSSNSVDQAAFGIAINDAGNVTVASNTINHTTVNGISIDNADDIRVLNNHLITIGTLSGDGIGITNVGNVTASGNTIDKAAGLGISVVGALDVDVLSNSLTNTNGFGIFIKTADAVVVSFNTLTAGGIDIESVGNVSVLSNTLTMVGGIALSINGADNVTVGSNTVSGAPIGILVVNVMDATVVDNTVGNVGGVAIEVGSAKDVRILDNRLSTVGTAVDVSGSHDVTVSGNTIAKVTADGVVIMTTLNTSITGNSLSDVTGTGVTVFSATSVNVAGNSLTRIGSIGIDIEKSGGVTVNGNTLSTIGAVGIYAFSVAGTTISSNSLDRVSTDGIRAASINGDLRVLGNSLDGIGANGIEASTVFGDVSVSNNTLHDVTGTGITTSNTGNVAVNGNSLDLIGGSGIVISTATSNAVVQNNTLAHVGVNGIVVGQLTDATITGNALSSITGTGISAAQIHNGSLTGNSLGNIGGDGINIFTANDLVVGANQMTHVTGDGIDISTVHGVSIIANVLSDTGQGAGGAGVRLDNYTTATIIGNSIVNLTAMTGMTISNGASVPFPQGNTTISGNVVSGNQVGIFTSGNVLGTISNNSITGNSQWGIVVGTGITQTHPDTLGTYLNLLISGNVISGNGVPLDHTLMTGGVRNDNVGMVLDARGNNWGDPSGPFASPTHFNRPNPGGMGNAVTDWVLYDIPTIPVLPPIVPPFGSLLDNFARGSGHSHTPGDVLAIGPAFTYNGALFDPYFVDLFTTTFALAEAQGGANAATNYALCYLGDMWKTDACKLPPGSLKP